MPPRLPMLVATAVVAGLVPAAAAAPAAVPAPTVATGGVADVGQTEVTLRGSVNPNGAETQVAFQYGTPSLSRNTPAQSAGSGTARVGVAIQVGGLKPDTTYRYRLVARNEGGLSLGAVRTFRTDRVPTRKPVAVTGAERDVTTTSATLTGRVNDRARGDASYVFEYGPTKRYGASTPGTAIAPSTADQPASAPIGGLAADTVYHYRLVLRVGSEVVRGADRTLRTAKEPNGLLLAASARSVRYGGGVEVDGLLVGSANAGRTIAIQADPFPFGDGWSPVVTVRSDATGAYRAAVPGLLLTTQLRAVADTSPSVISRPLTVGVRVTTTMRVSRTRVRRGQRVRFHGAVRPAQAGAPVSIQRRVGGHWRTIARARQHADDGSSRYSRRVRLSRSGKYRVVGRSADGGHVAGASSTRFIRVRR